MTIKSLDPRVTRADIPTEQQTPFGPVPVLDQLETWEVFHQQKRGDHPKHVGSLHAPNAEVALVWAKEQYARRAHCVALWVARTADVHTIGTEEEDIFATTPDKDYREAKGYRVGGRLTAFKRRESASGTPDNI